jgi:hypothetical protein
MFELTIINVFLTNLIVLKIFRSLAIILNLVSYLTKRKNNTGNIPLIDGIEGLTAGVALLVITGLVFFNLTLEFSPFTRILLTIAFTLLAFIIFNIIANRFFWIGYFANKKSYKIQFSSPNFYSLSDIVFVLLIYKNAEKKIKGFL